MRQVTRGNIAAFEHEIVAQSARFDGHAIGERPSGTWQIEGSGLAQAAIISSETSKRIGSIV
jgi:hypothetical protein